MGAGCDDDGAPSDLPCPMRSTSTVGGEQHEHCTDRVGRRQGAETENWEIIPQECNQISLTVGREGGGGLRSHQPASQRGPWIYNVGLGFYYLGRISQGESQRNEKTGKKHAEPKPTSWQAGSVHTNVPINSCLRSPTVPLTPEVIHFNTPPPLLRKHGVAGRLGQEGNRWIWFDLWDDRLWLMLPSRRLALGLSLDRPSSTCYPTTPVTPF